MVMCALKISSFLPPRTASLPHSQLFLSQFFISLHYHTQDCGSNSSGSLVEQPEIDTIIQLRKQDSEFATIEGSIFSSISDAFSTLSDTLQDRLVRHVVAAFKTGCKRYRKESWHLLE